MCKNRVREQQRKSNSTSVRPLMDTVKLVTIERVEIV